MLANVSIPVAEIAGIKPTHLTVLAGLLSFTDRSGRCWPSLRRLAQVCGMTLSRVQRAVAEMEQAGIVTRLRRGAGTLYQLAQRFLWRPIRAVTPREGRRSPAGETESPTSATEGEAKKEIPDLKKQRGWVRRDAPPTTAATLPAAGPDRSKASTVDDARSRHTAAADGPNPFARRQWLRKLNAFIGDRLSGPHRIAGWELVAKAESGVLDRAEQRTLDQLDRQMRGCGYQAAR